MCALGVFNYRIMQERGRCFLDGIKAKCGIRSIQSIFFFEQAFSLDI